MSTITNNNQLKPYARAVAFRSLVRKEVTRFTRIWVQTLVPPIITTSLYFLIFGGIIGKNISSMSGVSYMSFIIPGLILMTIINNSYTNVVSSFFSAKIQRQIEELIISPMPNVDIMMGYIVAGTLRGLLVGIIVYLVSICFDFIAIKHPFYMLCLAVLTGLLFSTAGLINAIFAKTFDSISIIPTFILTPLIYLGGVFYSINLLPPAWQMVSYFNPIMYLINGFRYSMLGISDFSIGISFAIAIGFNIILMILTLVLLKSSAGLRQ